MKYKYIGGLLILTLLVVTGCSKRSSTNNDSDNSVVFNNEEKPDGNQGIIANQLSFEKISKSNVPSEASKLIEDTKKKGFSVVNTEEFIYVAVYSGTKSTGGHTIEVENIEDIEGKTKIHVVSKAPDNNTITTQVITYPMTIVKFAGGTPNISVVDEDGNEYKEIK